MRAAEGLLQRLVRVLQLRLHLGGQLVRLLLRDDAALDELRGVLLADGRVLGDRGREQRLRVRGLVLLVVSVPAVADEVDDDVVAEAAAICECEPDRRDRRLRVVGVDVDDRDVEALREVARVARGAAALRVGREPDLVVGDQMQRAAGRVAVERLEVQRLRHLALARERRVAVDEHRERDGRVVVAGAGRAVGLLRAGAALDHRVDRLEMAGVRRQRDRDLAVARGARPLGADVVLHVAGAALVGGDDRVDRPLALELAQDLLVRASDDVREHVEPAAVRHADHDLVRARAGAQLDRLVEHRDHHVEALDGELLLPEERAAKVVLHPLDLAEPAEQAHALLVRQRLPVAAGLDRLPEPDALFVVGDVLDLVGHRPAVGLAEPRQRVGERVALDEEAEQRRGNPRLQLGRQLRDQPLGLQRRVAGRLRSERVEPCGEVAVHAERLDERHRGRDAADELVVDRGGRGSRRCGSGRRDGGGRGLRDRGMAVSAVALEPLEQPRQAGIDGEHRLRVLLEERAPLGGDRCGVVEVLLEQQRGVARVQSVDIRSAHTEPL